MENSAYSDPWSFCEFAVEGLLKMSCPLRFRNSFTLSLVLFLRCPKPESPVSSLPDFFRESNGPGLIVFARRMTLSTGLIGGMSGLPLSFNPGFRDGFGLIGSRLRRDLVLELSYGFGEKGG